MYSLDINFLNDRPEYRPDTGSRTSSRGRAPTGSMVPLFLGVALGVFLPAAAFGAFLVFQNRNEELAARNAQLDVEISKLQAESKKIDAVNAEIQQVTTETNALATVFNQIKPWSAMLQDIRSRIPAGVQIDTIQQTDPLPPTPETPNPTSKVEIVGIARSFNDVNDFLLTLQKSPFLKADQTQLVNADLRDNPTQIEFRRGAQATDTQRVEVKLPQVVVYRIQSSLSDVPASELLRELDRTGAVGLVTRIRTLQEKGVIQP